MPDTINRRILFSRLMVGEPREGDFDLIEEAIPEPGEGELLLRNLYVSIDPGSRARLSGRDSYVPAVCSGGRISVVAWFMWLTLPIKMIKKPAIGRQFFLLIRVLRPFPVPVSFDRHLRFSASVH